MWQAVRWIVRAKIAAVALFTVADAFFGAMDAVGTMGFDDPLSFGAGLIALITYFAASLTMGK